MCVTPLPPRQGILQRSCDPTLTPGGSARQQIITTLRVSAALCAPRSLAVILALFKTSPCCFGFHSTITDQKKKEGGRVSSFVFWQTTTEPWKQIQWWVWIKKQNTAAQATTSGDLRTVSLLNSKLWQGTQCFYFFFIPIALSTTSRTTVSFTTHIHKHPLCLRETL